MKIEYIGQHDSVTVGRTNLVICEKSKATEVSDELGHKLLKQKQFRKATSGHTTGQTAQKKED